ncbi:MAG: hypothetical protein LBD23_02315 [Oscillospiraceae bacterium]|nr:hypothetical protein [Oscillospiraceae bacterium]
MEIIIDEQFKALLPALDAKTFSDLEKDILENGVRDAIVLWDGILIDGYNRHAICMKHDLPFRTVSMEFPSREEVTVWIIKNQIIRRNLSPLQLSYFRGVHYRMDRKIVTVLLRLRLLRFRVSCFWNYKSKLKTAMPVSLSLL